MSRTIVIVGGVAGGATCAARARRLDESANIILFERGEHISYANCGLPYFVGDQISERDRLLVQTPERFQTRFRVDVRLNTEVVAIDRAAKTVTAVERPTGRTYAQHYDKLVLSPGAAPVRLPLPGIDNPRIFSLRTIADAERIKGFIASNDPARVAVVGGGFIGLEMTENLTHLGLDVTVVEMAEQVMLPLDREMAEFIHQHLAMQGVTLRLGSAVSAFEPLPQGGVRVLTRDGGRIECDFVVCAVGVAPEVALAREAGLELGRRGIRVNEHLQTSDPDIYAIGDAIEVKDRITGRHRLVPLAGLANKQGRLAADHIAGKSASFDGVLGTNIVRIFDLTVASTGPNERALREAGVAYEKSYTTPASHAGYYPGATPMVMKLLFAPDDGRVLGAQVVGVDGVDKRIDVLATAMRAGMSVQELTELELAYAPQFGTGKDAVNIAGYVASNILEGDVRVFHADELEALMERRESFLLDVRTRGEYRSGHIEGAVNVPVDELRERLGELPRDREFLVYCLTGFRSYLACRVLRQCGYRIRNLSGGYVVYCATHPSKCAGIPGLRRWKRLLAMETFCSTPQQRALLRQYDEAARPAADLQRKR